MSSFTSGPFVTDYDPTIEDQHVRVSISCLLTAPFFFGLVLFQKHVIPISRNSLLKLMAEH